MANINRLVLVLSGVILLSIPATAQQKGYDPFKKTSGQSRQSFSNAISSVEFVDAPVTTLFKMISDLTGWSIMMSPEVSKQPPRINIWVKNMTADEVLNRVIEVAGLVADRKGTTVTIMTFEEYCRLHGVQKRVFQLKHAVANEIAAILKPYVQKNAQSQIMSDGAGNRIILLVAKPLLDSLEQLVMALDVPFEYEGETIKILPLMHLQAPMITPRLEEFLAEEKRRSGTTSGTAASPTGIRGYYHVYFMVEPKLNVIVLRGLTKQVERAVKLITDLDIPQDTKIVSYVMQYTDAQEVFTTLNEIMGESSVNEKGRLRIALSEQNGRIVVEGSQIDHQRVASIIKAIDKPMPPGTGGVRLYRLENSTAVEIVAILQALVEEEDRPRARQRRYKPLSEPVDGIRRVQLRQRVDSRSSKAGITDVAPTGESGELAPGEELPPRIIAAPEINAVIIKATTVEHEGFAKLIGELDKPRDQVMIEVTGVMVRSEEGFDLGLELGGARINDAGTETVGFTHFGIGRVDTATGAIRLAAKPLFGLNYAIFNSDDFSLVLNALKTVGDTRIVSAPKLLVEDNSQARISQINQEPFEVTSQGETTTTTSFGGFVDAGTILEVTPHISGENWLRLTYAITLSSFGNRVSSALPPPRLQNELSGTVRVPDGHMIVLGGLVGARKGKALSTVPFLSKIPWFGELFKNRSNDDLRETLFIFVRPVIVRDPKLQNLIHLSVRDVKNAGVTQNETPTNSLKMLPDPLKEMSCNDGDNQ